MNKQNPCTTPKCTNFVTQRGTTLCNSCIDNKKRQREHDMDQFLGKINDLSEQLKESQLKVTDLTRELSAKEELCTNFEKEIETLKEKISLLEINNNTILNSQKELESKIKSQISEGRFENENKRLREFISKLKADNEKLTNQQGLYEATYEQLKLDNEKLRLDNRRLKSEAKGGKDSEKK